MDICAFVDSRDIRDHLRRIGYRFTAGEAAYLVWRSERATLDEKRAALRYVLSAYPDHRLPVGTMTAHERIRQVIALTESQVARFEQADEGCVWIAHFDTREIFRYVPRVYEHLWNHERVFTSPKAMRAWLTALFAKSGTPQHPVHVRRVRCDSDERPLGGWINGDLSFLRIGDDAAGEGVTGFGDLPYVFPTPFARGDLLCHRRRREEPLLLDYLGTWDKHTLLKNGIPETDKRVLTADRRLLDHLAGGDTAAKTAHGLAIESFPTPQIQRKAVNHYLDMEYYRDEPQGAQRILTQIAAHWRGDLSEEDLCHAYRALACEETVETLKGRFRDAACTQSCSHEEWVVMA